jgi:prevent-host-death family protein
MKVLPLAEVKAKLSKLVGEVQATDNEVTITKNGRAAAVLVSYDEFESWKETVAVTSDRHLMRELRKGIGDLKRGRAKLFRTPDLDRLFSGRR